MKTVEKYCLFLEGKIPLQEVLPQIAGFAGKYTQKAMNAISTVGNTGVGKRIIGVAQNVRRVPTNIATNMKNANLRQNATNMVTNVRNSQAAQAAKARVNSLRQNSMVKSATNFGKDQATGIAMDKMENAAKGTKQQKPTQ